MDSNRISRLTEQQRACLRYVYAHLTSKEIAPLMGIEPGSVDQHIKAAMKTLGVGDRRTASRILAEHESRDDVAPLAYQSPNLGSPSDSYNFVPPIVSGWQPGESAGGSMREEQAFFRVATPVGTPNFQLPLGSSKPGDLNWLARLAWIVAIAIGVALAFGALVSGIEALGRLTHG
jgi:DNA-binding CsgD family transcriptional regulator